jgi:hypothetical protein
LAEAERQQREKEATRERAYAWQKTDDNAAEAGRRIRAIAVRGGIISAVIVFLQTTRYEIGTFACFWVVLMGVALLGGLLKILDEKQKG